ncbi:MAG: allantoinase PuuE [Alphaproteobacteria bacterium]|nr:allantoinase PuuE [Alphaproteobacteria bacterium]
MSPNRYPRDLSGKFCQPEQIKWPNDAKIAVQFVLNYEEGGENCLLHGDSQSEGFLSEIVGAVPWPNQRHWNMESIYEYGARAGFWRIYELFTQHAIPITVYAVATALGRSPEQVHAMQSANWEIASHGYKWIEHKDLSPHEEEALIKKAIELHMSVTGEPPKGWYTGRASMNSVDLVCKQGSIEYISDSYADDLPYWHVYRDKPHLIIPYTLDANDMRFANVQGFNSGDQFFAYLKDSFDSLYREGANGKPKMLSIGLHCRLIGRPGRIESLIKFLSYIQGFSDVWYPRRIDISDYWHTNYPFDMSAWQSRVTSLSEQAFIKKFSEIFENGRWIAEGAYKLDLGPSHNTAIGLHNALCRIFRSAPYETRKKLVEAHSGGQKKPMIFEKLISEQNKDIACALDEQFSTKFGFKYTLSETDANNCDVLQNLRERLESDYMTEFAENCRQIEKIALEKISMLI